MDKKVTNRDYCKSAEKIKCEVAAIKAVSYVESKGQAYYADGFPVILFERHIFRKYTNGIYNQSHPELSGPQGNYGPAGQHQRDKFNAAFKLNPTAAMKACSWGKYQLMGFNYDACGFGSVGEFVDAMKESEGRQLEAFTNFVIHNRLDKYLRTHNWAAFAKGYNGTGYKQNQYDTKMASAYAKFSKENIDCSQFTEEDAPQFVDKTVDSQPTNGDESIDQPVDGYPEEPKPGEPTPDAPADPGQPVVGGRPGDTPKEVPAVPPAETSGWGNWVANLRAQWAALGVSFASLGSIFSGIVTNPIFIYILCALVLIAVIAGVLIYMHSMSIRSKEKMERERQAFELTKLQTEKAADPTKYNIVVKK